MKPQPNSKGTAVYVLQLNANVPVVFGEDINVTVYKTIDSANNNLSRTEGELTPILGSDGKYQYSKVDSIQMNGSLERVCEQIITNNIDIILEEEEFSETLQETTYYLVYEYLESNNNQDITQGKIFTGKVNVSLKTELTPLKPLSNFGIQETLVSEGNGLYEVKHKDAVIEAPLNTLEKNNLKQTEYRYAGVNPNNYVSFNNELWRVIGLVNTPEGSRLKLIRNESIGNYSWDTSDVSINSGYESELIGGSLYWNSQNGNCYNNSRNVATTCNFTSNGIHEEIKSRIDLITWNIGTNGINDYTNANTGLLKYFYNYERSNNYGKSCLIGDRCNDTVIRTTTWQGKVGLISPSDYGYATSGGLTLNREICLNTKLSGWNEDVASDCKMNNWIFDSSSFQWSINSTSNSINGFNVFRVAYSGNVDHGDAYYSRMVRPTIYLKIDQKIISGEGSQSSPYILK